MRRADGVPQVGSMGDDALGNAPRPMPAASAESSGRPAPRLHVAVPLQAGAALALPPSAVRHVHVLRLQPGAALTLFDGDGREWPAEVLRIGRQRVEVALGEPSAVDRELPLAVTLAVGMPANDRMDALIEKACELGAAAIQPLVCARSVLRLDGERAARKVAHWQAVAVAASEQCGRTRVAAIAPVRSLGDWLGGLPSAAAGSARLLASPRSARLLVDAWPAVPDAQGAALALLSGPEGGLDDAEEAAARAAGFVAISLGPRVLRADTAPLAGLAAIGLIASSGGGRSESATASA